MEAEPPAVVAVVVGGHDVELYNGTYRTAGSHAGLPRFERICNEHCLHLYYHQPSAAWFLKTGFTPDQPTRKSWVVSAIGELPVGSRTWQTGESSSSTTGWKKLQLTLELLATEAEVTEHEVHTELLDAAAAGDISGCRRALQRGATLTAAVSSSKPLLLSRTRWHFETTALHVAASHGHEAVIELLVAEGAPVDTTRRRDGATALHVAVSCRAARDVATQKNQEGTVALLLQLGADVDARRRDGVTPLIATCMRGGHAEIARLLVVGGADCQYKIDPAMTMLPAGWIPLQWAEAQGNDAVAEVLRNPPPAAIPESIPAEPEPEPDLRRVRSAEEAVCAYGFAPLEAAEALAACADDVERAVQKLLRDRRQEKEATAVALSTQPVSATAVSASASLPTAAEYCSFGISAAGAEYFLQIHEERISESTTTSDVCHEIIKPMTVPEGWRDEVELINPERRWYKHTYVNVASQNRQESAPPGTRSFCEHMQADPGSTEFVGKPTVFLSHAWLFCFRNVVAAMRAFQDTQPTDSPPIFFWFDTFSIDEHATQTLPQEWWGSTFKEAIRLIGHTCMMLSPWSHPVPLTRSWCLWELYCTVQVGARFSVCLGSTDQVDFEEALMQDPDVVLNAFAGINVEDAEAGSESDRTMILAAAASVPGGTVRLNQEAVGRLREWVKSTARVMAGRVMAADGLTLISVTTPSLASSATRQLLTDAQAERTANKVGTLLAKLGEPVEARRLFEASVESVTQRRGPQDFGTLQALNALATQMVTLGEKEEARKIYERVVAGCASKLGPMHVNTLSVQMNLANVLVSLGEDNCKKARGLYEHVIAGRSAELGVDDEKTLDAQLNLADLLYGQDELVEAQSLCERIVDGFMAQAGPTHINTLRAQHILAKVLRELGQEEKARHLFELVISRYTTQLGATHLKTLNAQMDLADLLTSGSQQVVEASCPASHQLSSFKTPGPFGCDLCQLGVPKGIMMWGCRPCDYDICVACAAGPGGITEAALAQQLYTDIVDGYTQQLGALHDTTLAAQHNLVRLLYRTGEHVEAHAVMVIVARGLDASLGASHPRTQLAKEDLEAIAVVANAHE